jgi:hypothetical protein
MPTPNPAKRTMHAVRSAADDAARHVAALILNLKEKKRQRQKNWQKAEAKWQQRLSTDLDASIGKLTYNDAFTMYGQPQVTIMKHHSEMIAVYQNGRLKFRRFPVSNLALLSCFPHGSRLELTFNATTNLVSWKYTEW